MPVQSDEGPHPVARLAVRGTIHGEQRPSVGDSYDSAVAPGALAADPLDEVAEAPIRPMRRD